MASEIRFLNVSKRYGPDEAPAVGDLTMSIPGGSVVTLVGPSGCGKTTTLKMINRLEQASEGQIFVGDEDIARMDVLQVRRSLGYVIQHVGLFPHMTVMENIAVVPRLLGWSRQAIRDRVDELLDLLGLPPEQYRTRMPRQLSGGQQQRVGVARGLAADPPVLLMDEPFGALDPITRERLQVELKALQQQLKKTIVFVTHDINEAMVLGDRVAVMRDGQLVQYDTPQAMLSRPASDFVADLVGRDRAIKYLKAVDIGTAVTPDAETEWPEGVADLDIGQPLEDALLAIMETGVPRVRVLRNGDAVGGITLMGLIEAVRGAAEARPQSS